MILHKGIEIISFRALFKVLQHFFLWTTMHPNSWEMKACICCGTAPALEAPLGLPENSCIRFIELWPHAVHMQCFCTCWWSQQNMQLRQSSVCKKCMAELPFIGKSNTSVHRLRCKLRCSLGQASAFPVKESPTALSFWDISCAVLANVHHKSQRFILKVILNALDVLC